MAYRIRDLLVRQRTQTINAEWVHLDEQGIDALIGPAHVDRLAAVIDGDDSTLPTRRCGTWRACFWTRSQI